MIPYEELDRALARWKSRQQQASNGEAGGISDVQEADTVIAVGSIPQAPPNGLPQPTEQTGEINLEEEVIETYDDDDDNNQKN